MNKLSKAFYVLVTASIMTFGAVSMASASQSCDAYHGARTSNPFTLKLGDNVSSAWDSYLVTTSNDWNISPVLDTVIVTGLVNPKTCKAVSGMVEVCNSKYGNNGWLGIASVWVNGKHITQGTVKMNDTYFQTAKYNTPAWRNLVLCQEIGHTFGLDHQDENFTNIPLGSCMDYSNDPLPNQHPNQHDYDELVSIYNHLDSITTVSQTTATTANRENSNVEIENNPSDWGKAIRFSENGKPALYERAIGKNQKVYTFVVWAD